MVPCRYNAAERPQGGRCSRELRATRAGAFRRRAVAACDETDPAEADRETIIRNFLTGRGASRAAGVAFALMYGPTVQGRDPASPPALGAPPQGQAFALDGPSNQDFTSPMPKLVQLQLAPSIDCQHARKIR
jgi:hypothetical protein